MENFIFLRRVYYTGSSNKMGSDVSEKRHITCGMPRGSILKPVLYLFYISDIRNSSHVFNFFLFLDDKRTAD